MLRPQRPRVGEVGAAPSRAAGIRDLINRYVKGLPVNPKELLYGGGPE